MITTQASAMTVAGEFLYNVDDLIRGTLLGDVNDDGSLNLLDIDPFIEAIGNGGYDATADINRDGNLNLFDVYAFIDLFNSSS